jgi:hypothetical protein
VVGKEGEDRPVTVPDRWASVNRTAWFVRKPGTDVPDSLAFVLENGETVLDSNLVFSIT